jgi:hypothetical protein
MSLISDKEELDGWMTNQTGSSRYTHPRLLSRMYSVRISAKIPVTLIVMGFFYSVAKVDADLSPRACPNHPKLCILDTECVVI